MQEKRIKIGVYLPNGRIKDVHLENPERGNPGIGGTQFLLFSLPYYLNKYYSNKFDFVYFVENEKSISSGCKIILVNSLIDTAQKAKDTSCDIIIFRPNYDKESISFLKRIKELKIKSIAWMHNTPIFLLNQLHRNKYIIRCVCVGREQYESLRDHPIIYKLSMIFNAVDSSNVPDNLNIRKTKSVVFLGSLEFAKGFHFLAKLWKHILKIHPDAELFVIGSGKLYDRNQKFGNLGVANEKYEKMFSKNVLNEDGNIHPSVNFLGVLGEEKFEIMSKGCVGFTNNPNVRETFCLSAVEFQLCGTPVVSKAYGGLLDTVEHEISGFLVKNKQGFIRSIDKLLSDRKLSSKMGNKGREIVSKKFNYKNISKDWVNLFNDVISDSKICILENDQSDINQLRKIRESFRLLKIKCFVFRMLPPSIYILHTMEFSKLKLEKLELRINQVIYRLGKLLMF